VTMDGSEVLPKPTAMVVPTVMTEPVVESTELREVERPARSGNPVRRWLRRRIGRAPAL